MSKPDTWMPLYIGDYLQDTTRLTTEQHGAYMLLIMDYWTNGPLPDDDAALAHVTRLQPAAWKKTRHVIARFFSIEDGVWRHKRIDEEREKASQFIAKQKANGSKGGRPRKNPNHNPNESQEETQKKPMGFDRDNPNHNPNESPSPSPTPVNPLSEETVACTQPYPDGAAAPVAHHATRVGVLCRQLRNIGIDAAPHMPVWPELLDRYTDEQIIAVAEIARERKPGERIHLHYIVPMLKEPPKAPAVSGKRKPEPDHFETRDYGQGGRL